MMIQPHGGKLVNRVVAGDEKQAEINKASGLQKIKINLELSKDVENIAKGVYSPLEGFLTSVDYSSVLKNKRLANNIPWTIPIVLDIDAGTAEKVNISDSVALEDEKGVLIATMIVEDKYTFDKNEMADAVYGTQDETHPGVAKVTSMKDVLIGGKVKLVNEPEVPFREYFIEPLKLREYFKNKGWNTVVGFQTRNIPHLGHEYIQKSALTFMDGLFINPVIGKKKPGDFRDEVILSAYETLIENYYPKDTVKMSILPMEMRYAGPREAIFHAIIRKNFGCTHFIVGRDHAGVGNFYHPFAAHEIFKEFPDIEIKPLFFKSFFYCKKCAAVTCEKSCPHKDGEIINFSGTNVRGLLAKGEVPSKELIREEVADNIIKYENPFVKE